MPSEKSRYLARNRGPDLPFEFQEIKERLVSLGVNHLADMIWQRTEVDEVLEKAAVVSICLRSATEMSQVRSAIDYAFHFSSDYIRYTQRGYGQILWTIKSALEFHVEQGRYEFALSAGQYAINQGEKVLEIFEDDWDWAGPLKDLSEWLMELKNQKILI
jgi:hypothetical protein